MSPFQCAQRLMEYSSYELSLGAAFWPSLHAPSFGQCSAGERIWHSQGRRHEPLRVRAAPAGLQQPRAQLATFESDS